MRTVGACALLGVLSLAGCTIGGDDGTTDPDVTGGGQHAAMPGDDTHGGIVNDNYLSFDGAPPQVMEQHTLFIVGDKVMAYGSLSEDGSCPVGASTCWDVTLTLPINMPAGHHSCADAGVSMIMVRGGTHTFNAKNCSFDLLVLDDAKRASLVNLNAETLSDTGLGWVDVTGGSFSVGFGN